MASNRKCRPYHEDGSARERQDCKGGQGMHAGVRERVHLLHHQRGLREMPAGEAQDGQRRGHPLCHDVAWLRELLRGPEDLSVSVSRDPPRKSEQAWRPIRCAWGQRRRARWRECPAARTERRPRHGRGQRYCLRLQRPQRKRQRRLLEVKSAPRSDGERCCEVWERTLVDEENANDLLANVMSGFRLLRVRKLGSDRGRSCVQGNVRVMESGELEIGIGRPVPGYVSSLEWNMVIEAELLTLRTHALVKFHCLHSHTTPCQLQMATRQFRRIQPEESLRMRGSIDCVAILKAIIFMSLRQSALEASSISHYAKRPLGVGKVL